MRLKWRGPLTAVLPPSASYTAALPHPHQHKLCGRLPAPHQPSLLLLAPHQSLMPLLTSPRSQSPCLPAGHSCREWMAGLRLGKGGGNCSRRMEAIGRQVGGSRWRQGGSWAGAAGREAGRLEHHTALTAPDASTAPSLLPWWGCSWGEGRVRGGQGNSRGGCILKCPP